MVIEPRSPLCVVDAPCLPINLDHILTCWMLQLPCLSSTCVLYAKAAKLAKGEKADAKNAAVAEVKV